MYKRQFSLNENDKIEMARQLKVMHEADIIESSETLWCNAPAFMVMEEGQVKASCGGSQRHQQPDNTQNSGLTTN